MTESFSDREAEELLASADFAERFSNLVYEQMIQPARELFGDRAVPFVASTLRTTADVLERLNRR